MDRKTMFLAGCAVLVVSAMTIGGSLQAPPGLFKDLNDEILGDAIILNGKQLFIGDQIEVNADAAGGSILVEALDPDDNVIEGFSKEDCAPLTTDNVHHVLQWNDNPNCHLVQARPIKLRFHLNNAKLYSFTPRIRHKHYVPSYD